MKSAKKRIISDAFDVSLMSGISQIQSQGKEPLYFLCLPTTKLAMSQIMEEKAKVAGYKMGECTGHGMKVYGISVYSDLRVPDDEVWIVSGTRGYLEVAHKVKVSGVNDAK